MLNGGIFALEMQLVYYIALLFVASGFCKTPEAARLVSKVMTSLIALLILYAILGIITHQ